MVRRTALHILIVTGLVSALSLGTWAFFRDTAGSTGNSFSSAVGDVDLRIKNNDTAFLDEIPASQPTWTMTNMAPGQYMDFAYSQTREISLRNAGSLQASTIDIGVTNAVIDPPGPASDTNEGTTDMDAMMEIVWMEYENDALHTIVNPGDPGSSLLRDANGNGWLDLDDLERSPVTGLEAPRGTGRFQMRVRFRPEADSGYQGDSVVSAFEFTLRQ